MADCDDTTKSGIVAPVQIGEKFRVAVKNKSRTRGYTSFWYAVYQCRCGASFHAQVRHVASGRHVSCGCHKRAVFRGMVTSHGRSGTKEYSIWKGIAKRCENPASAAYPQYGGRGVGMCQEWRHSFERFLEDMGACPGGGYTIERIDVNRGYSKDNCKWATMREQGRNKRNTIRVELGESTVPLLDACEYSGVTYSAVKWRKTNRGISWQQAYEQAVIETEKRKRQ